MRHLIVGLGFLLASGSLTTAMGAGPPKVESTGDGWYRQVFRGTGATYAVDTVARICLVSTRTGVSRLDCRALKRRSEWAPIITWAKALKSSTAVRN